MFGSTILDAAIAMIFIYLLTSLVVSAANELIAVGPELRAKNLFSGIRQLLQEGDKSTLASTLYRHPLISGLSKKGGKPSYIPSRTFVLAFLDVIAPVASESSPYDRQTTVRNKRSSRSVEESTNNVVR